MSIRNSPLTNTLTNLQIAEWLTSHNLPTEEECRKQEHNTTRRFSRFLNQDHRDMMMLDRNLWKQYEYFPTMGNTRKHLDLGKLWNILTKEEKRVLECRIYEDISFRRMEPLIGKSKTYCHKAWHSAIDKIRQHLLDDGGSS